MKVRHTFQKINDQFILTPEGGGTEITIGIEHPKWEWMSRLEADRIININAKGHMSSSKDYTGLYTTSTTSQPVEVALTRLDDLDIDESLFIPMPTGTIADKFLSNDGGFMPGSNIMAAGAPGVGKTTLLLELLYKVQQCSPEKRVLFISAEMNQLDMARYLKRFPHWGQLPILFLSDYTDQNPKQVIESTLNQGWDLVLTDSYTEVNDTVKEELGLTRSKTEKWFLDLMISQNAGANQRKVYTTFITILQLSKGGTFVGSNKLKHMTTAMMDINWKGTENSNQRYMEFSKNRLGQVGQKLFFNFDSGCQLDEARYTRDLLNEELIAEEREKLSKESDAFDKLFSSLPNEASLDEEARAVASLEGAEKG
jgi:predicted ATP-dependent serine protease